MLLVPQLVIAVGHHRARWSTAEILGACDALGKDLPVLRESRPISIAGNIGKVLLLEYFYLGELTSLRPVFFFDAKVTQLKYPLCLIYGLPIADAPSLLERRHMGEGLATRLAAALIQL